MDTYPEADGIVWLMGEDELIRYDAKSAKESFPPPLIRQVLLGENHLLYGGVGKPPAIKIAHGSEAIRFFYSSPGESVQPQFRTQLAGFDQDWSAWSTITERLYTNLPPGDYRFRALLKIEFSEKRPVASLKVKTVSPDKEMSGWAWTGE